MPLAGVAYLYGGMVSELVSTAFLRNESQEPAGSLPRTILHISVPPTVFSLSPGTTARSNISQSLSGFT